MTRNLKVLGLAFLAVFAMSAVAASAAHATAAAFTCGTAGGECTIKVTHHSLTPPGVFKTKAGNVKCENFHAIGTMSDGVKQSSLALTDLQYTGCELGGLFATVNAGPCHRTLFAGISLISGGATGSVDIAQTEGTTCKIEITAGECTITVKPQTGLESITYTNVKTGTKEEITAHTAIDEIKYETSAGCPGGAGEAEDGKYEETITMQAFKRPNETEQTDLTMVTA